MLPSRCPVWVAIPVALATGLLLNAILLLLKEPPPPVMRDLLSSPLSIAAFLLVTATIVPLAEEVCFRGVLWAAVRHAGLPAAVLITSAIFGLVHLTTYGLMLSAVIQTFVMGVMLAILRVRAGSIVPCIVAHAVLSLYAIVSFVAFTG